MQPFYEAQTLQRREVAGVSIPPLVTQIGDGENGGVMMNEFPSAFRQAAYRHGNEGVVAANVTEYLELVEQAGVTEGMLPACLPVHQGALCSHTSPPGSRAPPTRPWRHSSASGRAFAWRVARGQTTSVGSGDMRTS